MKKALSVFLAVLMLMSGMTLMSFAYIDEGGYCSCYDHVETDTCRCCIYCENLDTTYVLDCCKKQELNGQTVWIKCCSICNGLEDCECTDCECCAEKSDEVINDGNISLVPPSVQNSIIAGFQNAMRRLQEIFDKFFDAIFEFLRFDDFFGDN